MATTPPFGLTRTEHATLRQLSTPRKIQNFLEELPINHERDGDTCLSPRRVLQERRAHCIEAALLAALALRLHGARPLVVDLTATSTDLDHVIAVFRQHGHWGAISKSNHAVLRYRDPVYQSIRELVLSFFHEYTTQDGRKTLRSFTSPIHLSRFDARGWMTSPEDVWFIPEALAEAPHTPILSRAQISTLRRADELERKAGSLVQWPAAELTRDES